VVEPLPWLPVPILRPFRGLRYDTARATDLSTLICPPYDVIDAAERARLAALSAHNAVRLELPEALDADDPDARYAEAAHLLRNWQVEGILRREGAPVIYVYEQRFRLADGAQRVARGFYCRLGLEQFGPLAGVRPHERTMAGPKEDRYRLLRAVETNLSPVVLLYEGDDFGSASATLLDALTEGQPVAQAHDAAGVRHRLWLADPDASGPARQLLQVAAAGPLTIADGHHRYETALRYHAEHGRSAPPGADSVLALLYDVGSGGLAVLPTHRVLRSAPPGAAILGAAEQLFELDRRDTPDGMTHELGPGHIGLWTHAGGAVLSPRREALAALLPADASETLRWLDVSVLTASLETLVGVAPAQLLAHDLLGFTHDAAEALALVDAGAADACFLLPATPVAAVLAVAAAGEQMPHKSTYFHPKPATGLVFNPLTD
jgi:uncharacterized protein (DUF1015 family)